MGKKILDLESFKLEAPLFADDIGQRKITELFGTTDGKAIGNYIESEFRKWLDVDYVPTEGNAAKGIDFPALNVDVKTTKYTQPQSSCPFRNANQKMFGLGYHLLVFVYSKADDSDEPYSTLTIQNCLFVNEEQTADYTLTKRTREMVSDEANEEDLASYFNDRNLPLDDIQMLELARQVMESPPNQGYLTISNALQWRLQYKRAITCSKKGDIPGLEAL